MHTPQRRFQGPRFTRLPLAVEIALAVLFKLLLLFWLWHVFFSAPQAKKMRLPTSQVEQHLLATPQAIDNTPSHIFSPEAAHDANR